MRTNSTKSVIGICRARYKPLVVVCACHTTNEGSPRTHSGKPGHKSIYSGFERIRSHRIYSPLLHNCQKFAGHVINLWSWYAPVIPLTRDLHVLSGKPGHKSIYSGFERIRSHRIYSPLLHNCQKTTLKMLSHTKIIFHFLNCCINLQRSMRSLRGQYRFSDIATGLGAPGDLILPEPPPPLVVSCFFLLILVFLLLHVIKTGLDKTLFAVPT
jgi:hypothetical protein